jgi:hypothetical protein
VSNKTGSAAATLALPFGRFQLALDQTNVGRRYICQTGRCQSQDLRGTRRNIHVLPIVTTKQRYHLALKAPTAPFCIRSDLASQFD